MTPPQASKAPIKLSLPHPTSSKTFLFSTSLLISAELKYTGIPFPKSSPLFFTYTKHFHAPLHPPQKWISSRKAPISLTRTRVHLPSPSSQLELLELPSMDSKSRITVTKVCPPLSILILQLPRAPALSITCHACALLLFLDHQHHQPCQLGRSLNSGLVFGIPWSCVLTKVAPADFLAKKSGHPVDAKTNEKITDGARGLYEKFTGYVTSLLQ